MGLMTNHPLCGARAVTRLSELEIDADKAWNFKGIIELKELALSMHRGDILFRHGDELVKLSPGSISYELTSGGPGHAIAWEVPPGE